MDSISGEMPGLQGPSCAICDGGKDEVTRALEIPALVAAVRLQGEQSRTASLAIVATLIALGPSGTVPRSLTDL